MEALLGAGQSNPACSSVANLQAQLRDLLHNRVAETRADHTSVTFEIRATAIFDLPITETENEAPEGVSNIDPLLGGARSNAVPAANGSPGQPARRVNAIDALVNQPVDDPALQTTIARHIILSLRAVDSSNWTVRQVSRTEQGWTFTYICKDSWQAWNRQASKTPAKTAIGEWSEKGGQDPVHLARPAFDCRGSVKIAFSKATKTIDVKYEHTPIHKTVAELIELLAPPPIAPIIKTPAKKVKEPKAPKEPRPPKEPKPKTPRSSKKRVGEDGIAAGEGSQPKRSRKKKDSLAPISSNGAVLPPEMPGALPVGDPSARQLYNTQTGTPDGPQPRGSGSYPEGLVNAANDAAAASINSEVHAHSILNLPPGEAARRREVAIKLLSDNNLDPETLSAEQFNIFANQSPDLQNDSLAMLLEYGAERLRIVHPTKEASTSGQSTPNANNASPVATGAPQPVNPKKSRKRPETEGMGASETQKSEVGEGRQKRICDNCRIKKYKGKCDKEKPSCSLCVGEGVACVYPLSKPRQSKAAEAILGAAEQAGAEIPNDEPDGVGSSGLDTAPVVQPAEEPAPVDDLAQEHYDGHLHQTVNVQVPETTVHQAETPSDVFNQVHGIYQHPSGLSFPQVSATSSTEVTQPSIPSTVEQGYMPNPGPEVAEASLHGYTQPRPSAAHQKPAPTVGHGRRGSSGTQATASRRSLPAGQPANGRNTSATTDNQNGWQSMSSTPAQPTRTSPRQARVKKPVPVSKAYDDSRQQPGPAWGSVNQSVVTQPTRNSPIQAAVQPTRATSRQNNRSPPTAAQPTSVQPNPAQDYSYTQYQSGNTQAEPSGERVSYQPYSNQTSNQPSSYSTDSYDAQISNTTSSTYPAAASQNVASSYSSNPPTTTSTAQWTASTSTPQSRNTHAYNATQSAMGGSSYHAASNPPQSQALQGFNVRPPPAQPRASSSAYNQQLQQQQKQQHGQQHSQQQAGYNGYVNNMNQHQQPQQQAGGSHQNWGYGFGATANNAASGYNSAAVGSGSNSYSAAAGTSHGHGRGHGAHGSHGHPAQQQRSMNLSSHTYSSMDGEQSLYDLLRTNPAG